MNDRDMSLERIMADVVTNIPQKIYEVLSNAWGLVISSLVFCGTFLGDRLPLLWYITAAITLDAIWGVSTAIKNHKFVFSKLLTKSAVKIAAYVSIYALVALIEKGFIHNEFLISSSILAAILITSELWSILGHIAIAYPDWMVVGILKKYLKGEMSKKLGISEEELDKIMEERKTKSE